MSGRPRVRTAADLAPLVREYFPDVNDHGVSFLLWEHTPWPFTAQRRLYRRALARLKRTLDQKKQPCELCNRPLTDDDRFVCGKCAGALAEAREG